MSRTFLLLFLVSLSLISHKSEGQSTSTEAIDSSRIRLIITIVVDQMRYEFVHRYWGDFQENGFKRLWSNGYHFDNHYLGYVPSYTAPGHAGIFTGSNPDTHGIVANEWYNRELGQLTYCVSDSSAKSVGTKGTQGKMSPQNLQAPTFADALKLAKGPKSQCIGISLKDRGAIFAAGHHGDAAFWYSGGKEGNWISSSYYINKLPAWVSTFNDSGLATEYLNRDWDLLLPEDQYNESLPDNNPYERPFVGKASPTFPYDLKSLKSQNGDFDLLLRTPFGNDLTCDFALTALREMHLGEDEYCDFMGISFSSTDYVGHAFGPDARETQDCYLRLDRNIATLIDSLDHQLGPEAYLIVLTSDHGVSTVPSYLQSKNLPGGYWSPGNFMEDMEADLTVRFGTGPWTMPLYNNQIYLNRALMNARKLTTAQFLTIIQKRAAREEGVLHAYNLLNPVSKDHQDSISPMLASGFYPARSGDIALVLQPGWLIYGRQGSTHGSPYDYDCHVPLVFFGNGIKPGHTHEKSFTRDIAVTLSDVIDIIPPASCNGQTLTPYFKIRP